MGKKPKLTYHFIPDRTTNVTQPSVTRSTFFIPSSSTPGLGYQSTYIETPPSPHKRRIYADDEAQFLERTDRINPDVFETPLDPDYTGYLAECEEITNVQNLASSVCTTLLHVCSTLIMFRTTQPLCGSKNKIIFYTNFFVWRVAASSMTAFVVAAGELAVIIVVGIALIAVSIVKIVSFVCMSSTHAIACRYVTYHCSFKFTDFV
jgi:hypothetical protein